MDTRTDLSNCWWQSVPIISMLLLPQTCIHNKMTSYPSTIKESYHATNQQIYNFPFKATTLKLNRHRFARLFSILSTLICTLNAAISLIRKHATPANTCSSTTIPNSLKFPINPPPRRYYAVLSVCTFERYLVLVSTRQSFDHCCKMSIKMRMSMERVYLRVLWGEWIIREIHDFWKKPNENDPYSKLYNLLAILPLHIVSEG